jgi:capsular polysaccharide transport system permease protein
VLGVVYYGFVAAPQFDSVAVVAVELVDEPLAAPSKEASKDLKLIAEYIRSRAVLEALVRDHGLAEHYRSGNWLARLDPDAGAEETYAYYLGKLAVQRDAQANVLTIRTRAFTPEAAQRLTRAAVAAAETKVRELSDRAERNRVYLAVVAPPSLPDAAAYPKRLWAVATVVVTSLALVAILSLLGAAIREHAHF